MKEIIINTDASFNNSIAAWAYWIETPDGVIKGTGVFPEPVDNASMAELYSFEKAYQRIIEEYGEGEPLNITVFCDNLWVVHSLNGNIKKYDTTKNIHIAIAKAIVRGIRPHKVTGVHVKAHTNILTTPELRANNWCDFHSRELVRRELRIRNA